MSLFMANTLAYYFSLLFEKRESHKIGQTWNTFLRKCVMSTCLMIATNSLSALCVFSCFSFAHPNHFNMLMYIHITPDLTQLKTQL